MTKLTKTVGAVFLRVKQKHCEWQKLGDSAIIGLTAIAGRSTDAESQPGGEMSELYGLVVRFSLKPGSEAAFDHLVAETISEIRQHEPGTLNYSAHAVHGQPDQRIFYELYAERAAFEVHENQPHTRRFLTEREALLTGVEVDFLRPLDAVVRATQASPRD